MSGLLVFKKTNLKNLLAFSHVAVVFFESENKRIRTKIKVIVASFVKICVTSHKIIIRKTKNRPGLSIHSDITFPSNH